MGSLVVYGGEQSPSLTSFATGAAHADKLDGIKKAGVVRIAVFDSNPPFGYIDPQSKKLCRTSLAARNLSLIKGG